LTLGSPFDRRSFLKGLCYYVEKGWGSYKELIELSFKDFLEIKVGIEAKEQEEKESKALNGLKDLS